MPVPTARYARSLLRVAEDAALIQADGRGTGIVLDDDRAAESLLQGVAQRVVVPAKIDGEGDGALPPIDPSGDTDTDGTQVVAGDARGREGIIEAAEDGLGGAVLVAHGGGACGTTKDGAVGVDDEHGDLRPTDVDARHGTRAAAVLVDHRCTVRPSSRVSRRALAPRSVTSSPVPPSTIRVSRPSGPRPVAAALSDGSNHGSPRTTAVPGS